MSNMKNVWLQKTLQISLKRCTIMDSRLFTLEDGPKHKAADLHGGKEGSDVFSITGGDSTLLLQFKK